ncbi:EF-hand and coiled-coil domain-containing protein 1-like [Lineus longissimus]|uniref:EF-hand and coiled-coil domain-containing protein 1-like n=1 Tax=Lineus longissimus TaxID=88925 RepID=UPI00315DF314
MRAALQCSDSRCLALQVAVSNFQNACLCYNANQTLTPTSPCKGKDTAMRNGHTSLSVETEGDLDPETYIRELQRELKATRRRLYETNQKNKDLTFHMERMAETFEKTKAVILLSLERVKGLETQAKEIPGLEVRVLELQRELDRSKRFLRLNHDVTKDSALGDTPSLSPARSDSSSDASTKDSGQASREDLDLSIITTSLESINDMVDNMLIARLQEQVKSLMNEVKEIREERSITLNQISRLTLHNDALQTELHNTETERVRMSIIEEKLVDIVGSFRQLRRVHLPIATIGNLLMSVVEGIEDDVIAEPEVLIFVNQLQRKLTTYELTFWNPTPSPLRAKQGTYI